MYNVLIRPLKIEDALISWKWRNDPDIWKFTQSQPDQPITLEIEEQWLKKVLMEPNSKRFAILVDDVYVGNIQLNSIKNQNTAEYHIFIGNKNYWNKNIASIATSQIIRYAKEALKLKELYLQVNPNNLAAIKAYEKSNFKKLDHTIKMSLNLLKSVPPKVSVFMMVYNHENYIKEALNGILTQRCDFDSEIVIGEDFSSDSSRSIIVDFFNRFPGKFKLLFHEQNIGAQQNQQMVLDNCIGEFVAICEGDDYWTDPLKLQKQVDFLESHSDYSICFHPVEIFDQENNKLIEDNITRKVIDTTDIKELAKGNYIHTPSVMLRNDFVIPSWFAKCPIGDWTLYMIAVRDKKIKRLDDVMAVYRVHDQSMWSLKTNEHRILSTLKSIKLLIKSDEVGHEIKAILRRYALFLKNRLPERRNMFSEFMNKIKTFTKCLVL